MRSLKAKAIRSVVQKVALGLPHLHGIGRQADESATVQVRLDTDRNFQPADCRLWPNPRQQVIA